MIDLERRRELARVAAVREPVAAAVSPDGRQLWVANLLPLGPANRYGVIAAAAAVTVVDTRTFETAQIRLITGTTSARGIVLTADGKYALLVHILARYHLPTIRVAQGWMNANALTVIDVERREVLNTVLLDGFWEGAANPWGVACSADGRWICVSHAGTNELSVIDAWLKSLAPVPSPFLVRGRLSPAAERGRRLFHGERLACATCHPAPLYTDLEAYDVGSRGESDDRAAFDTPTLVEAWRTSPYLHDGCYTTIEQLLTEGKHGRADQLREEELADLVAFVLTL